MDVEMDEIVKRKDWDGAPPALWTLDLTTQKATRLTTKGFFAWGGCWLSAGEIIFAGQANGEKDASLNRMTFPGNERKLLIKKANSPSVAR